VAARRRVRNQLLNPAARLAVTLILAFVWPLACVRAIWWVLDRFAFHRLSTHLFAGATLLMTLSFFTVVSHPIDRARSMATWRRALAVVFATAFGYAILCTAARLPVRLIAAPIAISTFAAALAEEAVFRMYLPDQLSLALRRASTRPAVASIVVLLIPQLAFAAAHAENAGFASAGWRTFGGLFVAGLLYRGLTTVSGVWAAAAVHAALNLTIALAGLPNRPVQ
jgi:membrane protease YdiL (CAAX protease family)